MVANPIYGVVPFNSGLKWRDKQLRKGNLNRCFKVVSVSLVLFMTPSDSVYAIRMTILVHRFLGRG